MQCVSFVFRGYQRTNWRLFINHHSARHSERMGEARVEVLGKEWAPCATIWPKTKERSDAGISFGVLIACRGGCNICHGKTTKLVNGSCFGYASHFCLLTLFDPQKFGSLRYAQDDRLLVALVKCFFKRVIQPHVSKRGKKPEASSSFLAHQIGGVRVWKSPTAPAALPRRWQGLWCFTKYLIIKRDNN